jgi:hypothetical protein
LDGQVQNHQVLGRVVRFSWEGIGLMWASEGIRLMWVVVSYKCPTDMVGMYIRGSRHDHHHSLEVIRQYNHNGVERVGWYAQDLGEIVANTH